MNTLLILAICGLAQAQVAVIKTSPAPTFGNTLSLRAGHTATLDGTASTGSSLTYKWQCLAYDPGTGAQPCDFLKWSSHTTSTVTLDGLVFGDYLIQECVTSAGTTNCATEHIGAVAYDSNGVVLNADPNVDIVHYPQVAWGSNPWGFADERARSGLDLQDTKLRTTYAYGSPYSDFNPDWANNQPGTVAWTVNGKGSSLGQPGTTLHTAINSTDLSLDVDDVSVLDLRELPTRVIISADNGFGAIEEIRISATTGLTGRQTLTVPYDGRGVGNGTGPVAAKSWLANAVVGQLIIKGTGTNFLTFLCPGGAGSPVGPVVTGLTGSVAISAGSPVVTGTGTNWTSGNGVFASYAVAITAAHSSTPLKVVGYIVSVDSTTQLTLNRNLPAVDTTSGLSYVIVVPWYRHITPHFTRPSPYAGDAIAEVTGSFCDSDTSAFYSRIGIRDNQINGVVTAGGANWSRMDLTNSYLNQSAVGGINTYDYGGAFDALWRRSGLKKAKVLADAVNFNWIKYPIFEGVGLTGQVLTTGGGVIGASNSYLLTGTPTINDMRPFWNNDISAATCNSWDNRESGYYGSMPTYGARFDPDPTWRTTYGNIVKNLYARDVACKSSGAGADAGSYATGIYWSTSWSDGTTSPDITLTAGSRAATGVALPTNICDGLDSVTVTATNGSASFTVTSGTINATANAIAVGGRQFMIARTDATHGSFSVLWPGTNGSYTGITRLVELVIGDKQNGTFATSLTDPNLVDNYSCIRNSSTSITLDQPFQDRAGAGTTVLKYYLANIAGRGTQPFMLGIRDLQMVLAAPMDATLGNNYAALRDGLGLWERTNGIDPDSLGTYFARVFGSCESGGTQVGTFTMATVGCRYGLNVHPDGSYPVARQQNGESAHALFAWYAANPSPTNKDYMDRIYAAIYGSDTYDASAIHSFTDAFTVGNNIGLTNISNTYLAGNRYYGFFFGIGKAHAWPAIRVGGPAAAVNRTINVGFNLGTANHVIVTLLKPDGSTVSATCSSSPCAVTANATEGDHLLRIQYYTAGNAQLADSGYNKLDVQ